VTSSWEVCASAGTALAQSRRVMKVSRIGGIDDFILINTTFWETMDHPGNVATS